ncbi:U32 family peptidase [Streptomyces sp. NPDC055607]
MTRTPVVTPRLGAALLERHALPSDTMPPASGRTFPDGAPFRIEVPSVEGPRVMAAVLDEARQRGVTVNRVSQGSGAMLHSQGELAEMAVLGHDDGVEVCLFVGPREEWGLSAMSRSADAGLVAGALRGSRQLRYALEDVVRASEAGIRSFLVADLGLLAVLDRAREAGDLPASTLLKVSVMLAPSNGATARVLEDLGADTLNLPTDMSVWELHEIRKATTLPLDLYVEAPDSMGGVVRGEQVAELVEVAAPLYVKFGLRNSTPLYPSGLHLEEEAAVTAREKVRRAQVALEWLERAGNPPAQSRPGAVGLAVPEPDERHSRGTARR